MMLKSWVQEMRDRHITGFKESGNIYQQYFKIFLLYCTYHYVPLITGLRASNSTHVRLPNFQIVLFVPSTNYISSLCCLILNFTLNGFYFKMFRKLKYNRAFCVSINPWNIFNSILYFSITNFCFPMKYRIILNTTSKSTKPWVDFFEVLNKMTCSSRGSYTSVNQILRCERRTELSSFSGDIWQEK